MKNLKYFSLAVLVLSLLAIPAAAQKGRSNESGTNRGHGRADLVQSATKNTR